MAVSGERQAEERLTRIYRQHAPAVAAYVLRRTTAADGPDAVAETFLVAWRRRDVVPAEPETLPWLYGVARNVLANQHRGRRRRTQLADRLATLFVHHEVDPPSVEEAEAFSRVARALRRLPADDAEVLRLASWEALTPAQIATVLDVPPGTARQRLHRARRRLRAELERQDDRTGPVRQDERTVAGRAW
ncbi:MAG: RNA polymerase sigma factor [Actinomycetota bacterium]